MYYKVRGALEIKSCCLVLGIQIKHFLEQTLSLFKMSSALGFAIFRVL